MLLGARSIDLLTSALYEATDDSETRARVHDCYRIRKGVTCRTSLSYVKGVGKRQVALETPWWTMTGSEREGRRHIPWFSPPQSMRGGGGVA